MKTGFAVYLQMAITAFPLSYRTPLREVAKLLRQSSLDGKGRNEVVRSLDAIQVWQEWFADRYGVLKELRHRSNPDDPPDLDLVFEREEIGLEHTALKPYPLGHAQAIAAEVNPGGGRFLPSLSQKWTRDELANLALGMNPSWANASDEHRVAVGSLLTTLKRKVQNPASQIISVWDEAMFGTWDIERLARDLSEALNAKEFERFIDRTVILLHRDNASQFYSSLVRRGEPRKDKRAA